MTTKTLKIYKTLDKAARAYGKAHGYRGGKGGWIHGPTGGNAGQGWEAFGRRFLRVHEIRALRDEGEIVGYYIATDALTDDERARLDELGQKPAILCSKEELTELRELLDSIPRRAEESTR